jgi:hypothetical protein
MKDPDFLAAFESCSLDAAAFGHAAHVRAGYLYLRAEGFERALGRMRHALQRFAASLGQADRYHETITVAYLSLVQERLVERGDGGGWQGFAEANPDLLDRNLLLRFYSPEQLHSPLARKTFVLPHRSSGQ